VKRFLDWLGYWNLRLMRRQGWVSKTYADAERETIFQKGIAALADEQRRHSDTRRERDEARAFIDQKLQQLTELEPTRRYAILPAFDSPRVIEQFEFDIARERVAEIIEGKRRDIVIRVAVPAVFDYWNRLRDFRAIDEAFRYIAEAAARKIASTLRFGLTGGRS
jgi:hypothetical protein